MGFAVIRRVIPESSTDTLDVGLAAFSAPSAAKINRTDSHGGGWLILDEKTAC